MGSPDYGEGPGHVNQHSGRCEIFVTLWVAEAASSRFT